jgi:hypothetical protein
MFSEISSCLHVSLAGVLAIVSVADGIEPCIMVSCVRLQISLAILLIRDIMHEGTSIYSLMKAVTAGLASLRRSCLAFTLYARVLAYVHSQKD